MVAPTLAIKMKGLSGSINGHGDGATVMDGLPEGLLIARLYVDVTGAGGAYVGWVEVTLLGLRNITD